MKRQTFIATTASGGVAKSQLWDPKRPMILGYRLPWVLAQVQDKVFLKHRSGKAFQLSPEMIDQEIAVDLPTVDQAESKVVFKIRKAGHLRVVTDGDSQAIGDWYMFATHGAWVLESEKLGATVVGKAGKRKVFSLSQSGDSYKLKAHDSGLVLSGVPDPTQRSFSATDLRHLEISLGGYRWSFTRQNPSVDLPRVFRESSSDRLYRTVMAGVLALAAAFSIVVARFTPEPKPLEKKEGSFAKVRMSRTPERAAAPPPARVEAPKREVVKPVTPKVIVQKKIEPPKPVVPKVDPAIARAQNQAKKLQSSLASLLKMAPSANSMTKKVDQAAAPSVLDAKSLALADAQTEAMTEVTQQNVAVSGAKGGNYAQGASGDDVRALGTKGGGTVDIAGAGELGTQMSEEGLSKREVLEVIQKHMTEIRNCYEKAILRKADIEGKVLIAFAIGRGGAVAQASVKNSTVQDRFLDQCIVERVKTWAFPNPKGRSSVDVMYPFVFKRL